MTRILLADDSPHAQRMGERLLRDEGHEVVTVTDGDTVFIRLPDVDPDILILDANLPARSGYEIARFVKNSDFFRHAGVLLTGSMAEPVDETRATDSGADGVLQKPFDAAVLAGMINPLAARSTKLRTLRPAGPPPPMPGQEPVFISGKVDSTPEPEFAVPEEEPVPARLSPHPVKATPEHAPEPPAPSPHAVTEEERVRAAVTLALDAAMPRLIEELTRHTLRALHSK